MQSTNMCSSKLLYIAAQKRGLAPRWLSKNGLFSVHTASGTQYITAAKSTLNSQLSSALAVNKYHTRLIMANHGLPNVPFARPRNLQAATDFLKLHKKIIMKPIKGQGSEDIRVISSQDELIGLNLSGCIFEKYIEGKEVRYLILGGKVIAVHQSEYGVSVAKDRPLERISIDANKWDSLLVTNSLKLASVLGLNFCAVDFLVDAGNNGHILEVNTNPGLKWFHAPSAGPVVDVAGVFLNSIL